MQEEADGEKDRRERRAPRRDHDRNVALASERFGKVLEEVEREAREHRAKGRELAEGIRADADRQKRVILADAYREAEEVRGDGDAKAAAIYAAAYNQDAEFYAFYRSLGAYRESFSSKSDVLVLDPSSDFFRYLQQPKP